MEYLLKRDRILVKEVQFAQKSKGGLILGLNVEEDSNRDTIFGRVVHVGPGVHYERGFVPTELKEGDYVVFNPRIPIKFKFMEEQFLLLKESDVYMVVQGEELEETTDFESIYFATQMRSEKAPRELG